MLLGPTTFVQNYAFRVPAGTSVIGIYTFETGGTVAGPATIFQAGNSFMSSIPATPTVALNTSGGNGSLVNGTTYYTFVTYTNTHDESMFCSTYNSTSGAMASTCGQTAGNTPASSIDTITVTSPCSSPPTGVTGYNVYATSSSGFSNATLQNAAPISCASNFTYGTAGQPYITTGHGVPYAMPLTLLGSTAYVASASNYRSRLERRHRQLL